MISFTKREVKHLIFATLVLGFVFGFDDKRPAFEILYWLLNFFKVSLASAAVLLSYALAQKLAADHYGCFSEFRIWGIQRFGFRPGSKFPLKIEIFNLTIPIHSFPIGPILAIIVAFLSRGKLFFAAVASFTLTEQRHRRVGKRFLNITGVENAKIALSGVFAALLLAFVMSALSLGSQIVLIASLFAIFQMIPFSTLDGCKVFFGSLSMFAFSFAFILISAILLNLVGAASALLFAFIAAGIFFILFFYYRVYST